jgi:hypothetical protein
MSITIGLDFGTHQTKVCIENASNRNQKTYEFFKFSNGNYETFFLPSILQINADHKVNYGFYDKNKCLVIHRDFDKIKNITKPILIIPIEPKLPLFPERPDSIKNPPKPEIGERPKKKTGQSTKQWKKACSLFDKAYSNELKKWKQKCKKKSLNIIEWEFQCSKIQKKYNEAVLEYKKECDCLKKKYELDLKRHEFEISQIDYLSINNNTEIYEERCIYTYFKQDLFFNDRTWNHNISSEVISIWYLCNLLFLLRNRFGEDIFIQLGIPANSYDSYKTKKGICLLIAAYKLLGKFPHYSDFLNTDYLKLISLTEIVTEFKDEDKLNYGIEAIPEAYAGLISLTQKRKLLKGFNLLVDIGGGTTDVAFFSITEDFLPDIHCVESINKGLNFIFQKYALYSNTTPYSLIDVQEQFKNGITENKFLLEAISEYKKDLISAISSILIKVFDSYLSKRKSHNLEPSKLLNSIKNRPIIYSGGGSTFEYLIGGIGMLFSDVKRIDKEMLSIGNLLSTVNNDNEFAILSTSYGLSIPLENQIIMKDVDNIFDHIVAILANKDNSGYEHGLSDF